MQLSSWMRLDNAAKIYPASKRKDWTNLFRLSLDFDEEIDKKILKIALDKVVMRFPSISVKLGIGIFWYYLETVTEAPQISEETYYPTAKMTSKDVKKCAFRVIVYKNRLAVEFFHALTDGNGGLIFIKTLAAEYAELKYKIKIPEECGVLSRLSTPTSDELEDSFIKYAGSVCASRKEATPFHLKGVKESDGYINITRFTANLSDIKEAANNYNVSITVLFAAIMMKALENIQANEIPDRKKQKPIKVLIPVNLRKIFKSSTLRNFALYVTPQINPVMGEYTIEELCHTISHQLAVELTKKNMNAKFTSNVRSEQLFILKIMPLFIKNIAMRIVFNLYGENKSCICLSNLGLLELPSELANHICGADFILGPQATTPNNCGIISYGDKVMINFIRNIKSPKLEKEFYKIMRELGLDVTIQSNARKE